MGLFKKQKPIVHTDVDVEAVSRAFYDSFMFGDDKLVGIGNQAFAETVQDTIAKADPLFVRPPLPLLYRELIVLRLEVVGLYWLHHYGLDSAVEQSIFTQQYLHEKDLDHLWDEMDDYTQAVAASVVNQAGKAKKPAIYKMRADLADKYIAQYNVDDDSETGKLQAIGRAINRNDSETAWKKDLTKYYLALTLWKKINAGQGDEKLNNTADQQLMFTIRGLYEGAAEEL